MMHSDFVSAYMASIGLTAEQRATREGKLTASRMPVLLSGDHDKIYHLWAQLTGREEPESLDDVWHVRLGNATEPLNLWWYEFKRGITSRHGEQVAHHDYPWLLATLDAVDESAMAVVECKHVTLKGGRTLDDVVQHYQPQCQAQMLITGYSRCMLSIAVDTSPPQVFELEADRLYQAEMLEWARWFYAFVEADQPPVPAPVQPPAPPAHDKMREVDMMKGNQASEWEDAANDFLANQKAAKAFADAQKSIKEMMAPDVRRAYGAGIEAKRDRANRVSIKGV